jgi:hypothetical protein
MSLKTSMGFSPVVILTTAYHASIILGGLVYALVRALR